MNLGQNGRAVLATYYFFLILGGHVCLPLALATSLFSKEVPKRRHTFTNVLVCWILYATSSLLTCVISLFLTIFQKVVYSFKRV